jgi:hypothetical protein
MELQFAAQRFDFTQSEGAEIGSCHFEEVTMPAQGQDNPVTSADTLKEGSCNGFSQHVFT